MKDEASYVCESCGEEIVVPIDLSAGSEQEYVEDCPVCCCPNLVRVEVGACFTNHVLVCAASLRGLRGPKPRHERSDCRGYKMLSHRVTPRV